MRRYKAGLGFLIFAIAGSCESAPPSVSQDRIPSGAQALGFTKRVIDEDVAPQEISPNGKGTYKFYNGQWYVNAPPSMSLYSEQDGMLAIAKGGDLVSVARDFSLGTIPLLPGKDGFYVEFEAKMTSSDEDNWPALWLMPVEHNGKKSDQYAGDPPDFERWMELDVQEGGNGPGITGTVHSWRGIWPHYGHRQNDNNVSQRFIDPTQLHTYGASYDPVAKRVTWWVDDVEEMSSGPPNVPDVAAQQHFYLIMSAQSHGKEVPYTMLIQRIQAFVPPSSSLPAVTQ